ncbi:hypothetical protein P8631_05775 [Guyparkeria sp. 1SP6A2]|nr:hypothetical protein [Guyparkeria sp. 1SP6A2]
MDKNNLFNLYEKLYFHEIDARDRIQSRLQIPLALLLGIASAWTYLAKQLPGAEKDTLFWIFIGLLLVTATLFASSLCFFAKAYFGNEYHFIPSANDTESYRKTLLKTYEDYEDGEQIARDHFKDFLYDYYANCSSKNAETNDNRTYWIHNCNKYVIILIFPLSLSFFFQPIFNPTTQEPDRLGNTQTQETPTLNAID